MKGFRNFLMQGNVVVMAVGLVVALAFSGLIKAFTTGVIDPIVNRAQGNHPIGLGVQLGTKGNMSTFVNFGTLVTAAIYFLVFMAVVYLAIVVPYKRAEARRGATVFGAPAAVKSCPYCLSSDLPAAATKCMYCTSDLPAPTPAPGTAPTT
ncbi:MAG TPA: MscL family protein [Acidimicrobiales bacterium]|nr:MscL family protein [Acidimicrobiales bacterium]